MIDGEYTIIYEDPIEVFDLAVWEEYRDRMKKQVEALPDRVEPKDALEFAEERVAWIKNWQKEQQQAIAETA